MESVSALEQNHRSTDFGVGGGRLKAAGETPLPFNGFCPLQRGFSTCFSLAFVPSFAEAGREARLKPALFSREDSLSPTG
jgi:hypothetical protein